VPDRRIPPDAVVRFPVHTLWREYQLEAIAAFTALGVLVLLVAGLLVERRRRRRAELEARQRLIETAHLSRSSALGELSASIAHQLNQSLGAISNNLEAARLYLAAKPPAFGATHEALAAATEDNWRAAEVIRRLQSLFRQTPLEIAEVSLNALVRDTIDLLDAEARGRHVTIRDELPPHAPTVAADAIHLQQVLLNLLLNAMDAVTSREAADRLVIVRAEAAPAAVRLSVSDSGSGIPPDAIDRVFEPFYTTKPNGTGIGLSVSRTIIEAHGGHLSAENRPGGGATLAFTVPRWSAPRRMRHAAAAAH
jgi:signal transduction histidine kinase